MVRPDHRQHPARSSYEDDTFRRLREVKAGYDPDNLFRVNHNIPPAAITR